MKSFWKISPWITRLILMFPTGLFMLIGIRDLSNITSEMGGRGIAFLSENGATVARVGFGAFPLAFGVFLFGCLFFEDRLLTALSLVATLDMVVLIVRVAGMFIDSSVSANIPLVRAEVLLLMITAIGISIEVLRKRRGVRVQMTPAMVPK